MRSGIKFIDQILLSHNKTISINNNKTWLECLAIEDSQRPSTTSSHPAFLSEFHYNSKIHQVQVQIYEIEF